MINNNEISGKYNILRPISMALVGLLTVTVISCWLGQVLVASGLPKEHLNFIFLAVFLPAVFLGIVALTSISYLLFPDYNDKIENYLSSSKKKVFLCLITGIVNTVLVVVLLNIKIIAIFVLIFFVVFTTVGFSNTCKIIGDKVYNISGEETTHFKSLITGVLFFEMLLVLPFIGQFFFVVALLISLGAAIIALFLKRVGDANSIHQI